MSKFRRQVNWLRPRFSEAFISCLVLRRCREIGKARSGGAGHFINARQPARDFPCVNWHNFLKALPPNRLIRGLTPPGSLGVRDLL